MTTTPNPNDTPKPPASTPPLKPFPGKPNSFSANNQNFKAMMNNKGKNMSHGIQSHGQSRGGGSKGR